MNGAKRRKRGKVIMGNTSILTKLKNELGDDYHIRHIDLEQCLYRDFGNGFDVEISDIQRANQRHPVTLYLWFKGKEQPPRIVKSVDVDCTAASIAVAVDKLYVLSQKLITEGCEF